MGKKSKARPQPPRVPLDKALTHCRTALAGAELAAQRYLQVCLPAPGPGRFFHGVLTSLIEAEALLVFLARSERLLRQAVSAGGGPELAQAGSRFYAKLPDAKVLRDMVEHVEDYESGVGRRQEKWGGAWPPRDYVGPHGQRIGAGAIATSGPSAAVVLIEGDKDGRRVTPMLGGRLDVSAARAAAAGALDAVTAALDRVRMSPRTPAPTGGS